MTYAALEAFGVHDATIRLIKYAAVITLRAHSPQDGARDVLRIHPVERHPLGCLRSELRARPRR